MTSDTPKGSVRSDVCITKKEKNHLVYNSFGWMPRQNIKRTCHATKSYGKVLNSLEVPVIRRSPLGKPIIHKLSELKHLSN